MIRPLTFSAQEQTTFAESLSECVAQLESYISRNQLLGVIFFIDSNSDADYFVKKKLIERSLIQQDWLFPFNVQAQSAPLSMTVEVWLDDSAQSIEYLNLEGSRYTRSLSAMGKSVWGIGITYPSASTSLESQIDFSFETIRKILAKESMVISDIVRQWNYIPNILDVNEVSGKTLQNYQVFNEIRQKYYSMDKFCEGYPSATGIGTKSGNFNLDFFAVQHSESVQKYGLSNPKQQDAYKYDQDYLVGDAVNDQTKKTPLFERAKLLKTIDDTTVFISGTASIIGQESVGQGDVCRQTEITINNIHELIPTSLKHSIRYSYMRAYIKKSEDFEAVRSICHASFPNVNVSYLQADVCRGDLLVEIEGAAVVGH